jgi:hypothetical protein
LNHLCVPVRAEAEVVELDEAFDFCCRSSSTTALTEEFRKVAGRPIRVHDLLPPTHAAPRALKKSRMIAAAIPDSAMQSWRTLGDALAQLPKHAPDFSPYSPSRARVFESVPPGHNWRYIRDNPELFPEGFLEQAMGGALNSSGGRVGFWRRLSWHEPSPTLTTLRFRTGSRTRSAASSTA